MSFIDNYHKLLAFKHPDVEEVIDMQFHRPAAAVFASSIYNFPITPNMVTYASLLVGWFGAYVMHDAAFGGSLRFGPMGYMFAGNLFLFSVILDCADGQIARAKGGGTTLGRIVDGLVDALVVIALYIVMTFDVANRFGVMWGLLTGVAGFCAWAQVVVYDKVKAMYLARTSPSSADGNESMEEVAAQYEEIQKSGSVGEKIGFFIYYKVLLQVQEKFAPGDTKVPDEKLTPEAIAEFRKTFQTPMRIATFLGLGTHMFFIYTAVMVSAVWPFALLGLQITFVTTFNLVLAYTLFVARKMADA